MITGRNPRFSQVAFYIPLLIGVNYRWFRILNILKKNKKLKQINNRQSTNNNNNNNNNNNKILTIPISSHDVTNSCMNVCTVDSGKLLSENPNMTTDQDIKFNLSATFSPIRFY